VLVENALNAAVAVAVLQTAHLGETVAAGTMLGLQLTMNAWASHVPHRAPQWLLAIAATLEWTHSPVVLSLVYHLEHHAHPRLACMDLRPSLEVKESPLLVEVAARPAPLAWAQLQVEARPRPRRLRGMS
jgi:fatty acid desaturase